MAVSASVCGAEEKERPERATSALDRNAPRVDSFSVAPRHTLGTEDKRPGVKCADSTALLVLFIGGKSNLSL